MYSDLFQKKAKISAEWKLFLFICAQNDTYYLEDVPVFCLLVELGLEDIIEIILGSFVYGWNQVYP